MTKIIIQLVMSLWPFIREMLFGKSGATQVVSRNKTAATSIILNLLLSIVVFFLIDLVISVSNELAELKRSVLESNSSIKLEMMVLQQNLDISKKEIDRITQENKILKGEINRIDPGRKEDINERLQRLNSGY